MSLLNFRKCIIMKRIYELDNESMLENIRVDG